MKNPNEPIGNRTRNLSARNQLRPLLPKRKNIPVNNCKILEPIVGKVFTGFSMEK
jgi:hypothetical protein